MLTLTGWNWRPSALPRVKPPLVTPILYGTPVDMSTMPSHTEAGYRLPKTESEFLWGRLKTMAIMYLALDFLATRMCMDPFFLLGPEYVDLMDDKNIPFYMKHDESLQPVEQLLILWGLAAYRQVFSLAAVAFSISIFLNGNDLAQYYIFSYIIPCRGELWQQPPTFGGSIRPIIDRGIAGLWGSLWHQTFRVQFAAPSKWLLRRGYVKKGTPVAGLTLLLVSFLQSGLLHCAGGVTAIPPGNIWRSIGFFLSQALGIIIQTTGAFAFRKYFSFVESSRFTCQMANGIFMMIWLHLTGMLIVWDITYAGAWLLEPIPFSFLRMLGFGFPEDRWWRWNPEFMPWWYTGKHWWQSGITL